MFYFYLALTVFNAGVLAFSFSIGHLNVITMIALAFSFAAMIYFKEKCA